MINKEIENGVLKRFKDKPKGPTTIILGDEVKEIGEYAFSECRNIIQVILPLSLKEIGDRAFANSCIQEIVLSDNIERIGKEAFANCEGLTYIEIPNSVLEIDEGAFSGCINLRRVVFNTHVIDNTFVFENKIKKISARTFDSCKSLEKIEFPKYVETIGEHAFAGCSSLKTIVIPESVTTVKKEAFAYCKSLSNIVFSGNISEMGDGVFIDCIGLENVILSCEISAVPKEMFARCRNLKNVIITEGKEKVVNRVEEDAFIYCEELENVIFPRPLDYVGAFAFGVSEKLRAPLLNKHAYVGKFAFNKSVTLHFSEENSDNSDKTKRETIYEFMLRAAEEFKSEPQILKMLFSYGDLSIKIIADEENNKIFSLYGCDEDGNVSAKQPLCIGNVDEIVSFLNDKNNIDDVMKQILFNENV